MIGINRLLAAEHTADAVGAAHASVNNATDGVAGTGMNVAGAAAHSKGRKEIADEQHGDHNDNHSKKKILFSREEFIHKYQSLRKFTYLFPNIL